LAEGGSFLDISQFLKQGVDKRSGRAGNVNDGGLNKMYNRFVKAMYNEHVYVWS
jgi:hypothetical protein